jgi:cytoskeletal protein CcmA (bactofilin family)
VLATGTDVVIDGTINGDLWAFGSTITVNGPVSGSLVAVAKTVTLNGEVGGSAYVAGRTLTMGETAFVVNDVHFAGILLDGQAGSRTGRDLGIATVRARLSGQLGRSLSGFILLMTFDGKIGTNTTGAQGSAPALQGPVVGFGGPMGIGFGLGGVTFQIRTIGLAPKGPALQEGDAPAETSTGIPDWLAARLNDLLILVLVGGLVIWLRPKLILRPAEWLRRRPVPAAGFGLLFVLLSFSAVVAAIVLAVALLIGGIWLGIATLWALAIVLWGIGYPALILGLALLVVTIVYGSKIVVAYLVGSLILTRLAPKAMEYRILPLLLGLVIYVLLRTIPYAGPVIDAIVTLFGLGAIWLAYRHRERRTKAPGAEEQVEPALAPES